MKKWIGLAMLAALLAGCETMQKKDKASGQGSSATSQPVKAAKKGASNKKEIKETKENKESKQNKSDIDTKTPPKAAEKNTGKPGVREVKGINGWEGQIIGTPFKSKFSKLKIGMGPNEVISIAGKPTDSGSHITGKAWIPFYYGSGRHETIFHYKGVGRLIFSGGAGMTDGSALTVIEYDKSERGFR